MCTMCENSWAGTDRDECFRLKSIESWSAMIQHSFDSDRLFCKSVVMSSRTNDRQISILINFLIELINGGRRNEEDDSDLNGFVWR